MEYSIFLYLDGIRGDSRISPFIGWIPVYQATSPANRIMGRPPRNAEVGVVVPHGAHSPSLVRASTEGRAIRKAEIAFTHKGSRYQTLKMTDVFIASFSVNNLGAGHPPTLDLALVPKELKILAS